MAKSKRSCYLCGNTYEYCDCNRQPPFMATFCSENCKDIFKTLCSYGSGMISAEDCKELLGCCDLSNKDSYKESIRGTIDNLYAIPSVIIEEPKVAEEPVVESVVEEVIEEVKLEQPAEIPDGIPEFNLARKNKKRKHEVVVEDI